MPVIYTIAHPFTNDIVYVGCSHALGQRATVHVNSKSNTDISKWIQALKDNFMLPKIEPIDFCDQTDALYFEQYWIHQLTVWGFKLLNKNKTICLRTAPYVKKTPEQWAEQKRLRIEARALQKQDHISKKAYKWTIESFDIGKTYEVEIKRARSFKEMMRQYLKAFNLKRHFSQVVDGDKVILTIHDGERIYLPTYGVSKSGKKRYRPLLNRPKKIYPERPKRKVYFFEKVQVGDILTVEIKKWVSFKNTLFQFNKLHNTNICIRYKPNEDYSKVVVTIVDENEQNIKNTPIPVKFTR